MYRPTIQDKCRTASRVARFPCIVLIVVATSLNAAPVYRCKAAGGVVAYQDQPCATGQRQSIVKITPAATYAPPPHYVVNKTGHPRTHATRRRHRHKTPISYECRASDGEVFYRHGGCPHSVASATQPGHRANVSSRRVSRSRACAQIRRAGAIGRRGHQHDQVVSTYERDLGHDPCD